MSNRFGITTDNLAQKRAPKKSPQQRLDEYAARRAAIAAKHAQRLADNEAKLFAWERADWNKKARKERPAVAPVLDEVPRPKWMAPIARVAPEKRERYIPKANDTSPAHIRRLRAAYCEGFVKTGALDETLGAQLREFASASRKTNPDAKRVSPKHEAQDGRQRPASLRVDRGRDDGQPFDAPTG